MRKLYYRVYQGVFKVVSRFLPWREPILIEGEDSIRRLPEYIKEKKISNVLIVTDAVISSLGLMDKMLEDLKNASIRYTIYDKTVPNPTVDNIEEALILFYSNKCEGIIAFGGGSSMDCAKGVGARVARPKKSVASMKGVLKIRKRIPTLFAVPTTAGTGSEATLAAVISNRETHEKYPINDTSLIPHYAVLDPLLTVGLPPHITSTTGMDALTHAVEAYIGRSNTAFTHKLSRDAVKLIFENIYTAYSNGADINARKNMQKASYYAGVSFTRAYVGYVHAVAHTLGGFYGTPHGLANAVILPYVLDYFGESVHKPLSELSDLVGLGSPDASMEEKSNLFISAVKDFNSKMNIPLKIKGIKEEDIPLMVDRAYKESNPLYPVPRIFSRKDFYNIYQMIKE
ncbi:MAG: iron-containing alcohol dehydrogenase [Eubacteriales bacterium]